MKQSRTQLILANRRVSTAIINQQRPPVREAITQYCRFGNVTPSGGRCNLAAVDPQVALHEAGHAVMMQICEIPYYLASVDPNLIWAVEGNTASEVEALGLVFRQVTPATATSPRGMVRGMGVMQMLQEIAQNCGGMMAWKIDEGATIDMQVVNNLWDNLNQLNGLRQLFMGFLDEGRGVLEPIFNAVGRELYNRTNLTSGEISTIITNVDTEHRCLYVRTGIRAIAEQWETQ